MGDCWDFLADACQGLKRGADDEERENPGGQYPQKNKLTGFDEIRVLAQFRMRSTTNGSKRRESAAVGSLRTIIREGEGALIWMLVVFRIYSRILDAHGDLRDDWLERGDESRFSGASRLLKKKVRAHTGMALYNSMQSRSSYLIPPQDHLIRPAH